MRIPRPPPPAEALTKTGKPISLAIGIAVCGYTSPDPGTTGIPSCWAVFLAVILSPIIFICSEEGPMNLM
ncbi:hypothetical protein FXW24_00670 [Candidatus Liberibacter asiaticus]|nr:hypothetical protein FXW24_00670 [Candidatus Liberibacter asiaticus]